MQNHSLTRKLNLPFFLTICRLSFIPQHTREHLKFRDAFIPKVTKKRMNTHRNSLRKKKKMNWNRDTRDNPSRVFNTNLDNAMLSYSTTFSYIWSWYAIQRVIFLDVIARNSKNRSAKGNCKYNIMCGYKNWNPLFCEALHRTFEKSTFH